MAIKLVLAIGLWVALLTIRLLVKRRKKRADAAQKKLQDEEEDNVHWL